jgi:MFS family permease
MHRVRIVVRMAVSDKPQTTPAQARESRTMLSAALANGPRELLDFLLPLWAGAALGASATQVGVLVAVELAVSVVARPVAGNLADAHDRRRVAAAGALLYGLSCAGYALAGGLAVAYAAAAIGGVGGALLWVSVRAMVGERLTEDSAVYPRLTAAEETGAWVAFVAGLAVLGATGYRTVFLVCAAACVIAAGVLLAAPARAVPPAPPLPGSVLRRLRPMLLAVALTMAAESAVALLLLLRLQQGFDLEITQIAYVFLPGAIVMSLLPEHLHRFVVRFGRTRVLAVASVSSAAFAASLAWAPNPWVIAGLWVLSGVAWAAVIPIQQAVIAEASGSRVGRGMGAYEAAVLLGGLFGSLAAGVLFDVGPWTLACLLAAAVILSGAVLVPWSVRAVGVLDHPPSPVPGPMPAPSLTASPGPDRAPKRSSAALPAAAAKDATPAAGSAAKPTKSPWRRLGEHAALYAAVQVGLLLFEQSWLLDLATGSVDLMTGHRDGAQGAGPSFLYGAGRIWTIVIIIDALWTTLTTTRRR